MGGSGSGVNGSWLRFEELGFRVQGIGFCVGGLGMSRLFLAAWEGTSSANAGARTYDANRIDHVSRGHFYFRGGEILTEGEGAIFFS